VKAASPELILTRVLEGLGRELIDATDEEITGAARELRMDLGTGSAAFAGIKFPARPQLSDFFDLVACQQLQLTRERLVDVTAPSTTTKPARKSVKPRRIAHSLRKRDSSDK
jgi:hypothetical protein